MNIKQGINFIGLTGIVYSLTAGCAAFDTARRCQCPNEGVIKNKNSENEYLYFYPRPFQPIPGTSYNTDSESALNTLRRIAGVLAGTAKVVEIEKGSLIIAGYYDQLEHPEAMNRACVMVDKNKDDFISSGEVNNVEFDMIDEYFSKKNK